MLSSRKQASIRPCEAYITWKIRSLLCPVMVRKGVSVAGLQKRIVSSSLELANMPPSLENTKAVILSVCPMKLFKRSPLPTFQNWIVLPFSRDTAPASICPSGLNVTAVTSLACAISVDLSSPVRGSQTRIMPSLFPLARLWLSGAYAIE